MPFGERQFFPPSHARTAGTCLNFPAFGTILHGEREEKFSKSPQKVVNVGLNPQDSSQAGLWPGRAALAGP